MRPCNGCGALTDNPKYCSRKCSNGTNNKITLFPKRKPEGSCKVCGKTIRTVLSYCSDECNQIKKDLSAKRKRKRTSETVIEWRREIKRKAVEYLGGKCIKCGYDKCVRALQFHHRNPEEKEFAISNPSTRARIIVRLELDKCDLLCANCHAEEEDRLYWSVPQSEQDLAVTQVVLADIEGSNPSAPAICEVI